MKKWLLGLVLVSFCIILFKVINSNFSFKEDLLYSQNDYFKIEENSNKNTPLITRQEALSIAKKTFEEGLDIDLDKSNMTRLISIYRDSTNKNSYLWHLGWSTPENPGGYVCVINSSTGDVVELYIKENVDVDNEDKAKVLSFSNEDALSIMEPLMSTLGIDINKYDIKSNNVPSVVLDQIYDAVFVNKNNRDDVFSIRIDIISKSIVRYQKEPSIVAF